jgi:hypothetical protein
MTLSTGQVTSGLVNKRLRLNKLKFTFDILPPLIKNKIRNKWDYTDNGILDINSPITLTFYDEIAKDSYFPDL